MKVLIFILLLSSNNCYSQIGRKHNKSDTIQYKCGAELIKFSKIHFAGATVETIGVVTTLLSTTTISNNSNTKANIASVGAIISFVGVIIESTSYKHIKRAGLILDGNGIAIPLDHKKKHSK